MFIEIKTPGEKHSEEIIRGKRPNSVERKRWNVVVQTEIVGFLSIQLSNGEENRMKGRPRKGLNHQSKGRRIAR